MRRQLKEWEAWQRISRKKRYSPGLCAAVEELESKGLISADTAREMKMKLCYMVLAVSIATGGDNSYLFPIGGYLFPIGEVKKRQRLARILSSYVKFWKSR